MSDPLVCDLTLIMRARLLFGLYNRRVVPRGWRGFAKAYCLIIFFTLFAWIITCYRRIETSSVWCLYLLPSISQYALSVVVSLWTEDEYIYTFYSQNRVTDVTLDSFAIFYRLKTQIKKLFISTIVLFVMAYGTVAMLWYNDGIKVLVTVMSTVVLDQCLSTSFTSKLLIMGLFNSRILILRRRLERYGFRAIGRAPPQPYCQIYDEIIRRLDATDNPLKLLLFFDLINNSVLIIGDIYNFINVVQYQILDSGGNLIWILLTIVSYILRRICFAYGLESASTHCDAMAAFTVVQLIKTPTEKERAGMYWFLNALERRGARYHVLRALPLDARLMLTVIGFCTSQAIVLINLAHYN